MYHKDAVLHPRKLDWMLLHRRNDLVKVMRDNGSFVSFPKMGSRSNLVTVYAESRVNAERTLRSLHFLVSPFYQANENVLSLNFFFLFLFFNRLAVFTKLVSILIIATALYMVLKAPIPFSIQSRIFPSWYPNYPKYQVPKSLTRPIPAVSKYMARKEQFVMSINAYTKCRS